MEKKELKKIYQSKIDLIQKYNQNYFENNKPIVSDKKYDELKQEILALEKKHSYLKSDFSPSKSVGFRPSKNFKKYEHRVPMLSLANAFSEEDLINTVSCGE